MNQATMPSLCRSCYHSVSARVPTGGGVFLTLRCANAHIDPDKGAQCPQVYCCTGYVYEPGTDAAEQVASL